MVLDQLIIQFCSTKEQFRELFDISERTYQRWNPNPPPHITNLFRLAMTNKPNKPDPWKHWTFDREFIIDPDGNSYHQNEIRAIFFNRQLIEELTGRTGTVCSLKKHLEAKIQANSATIKISLESKDTLLKSWELQP